VSEAVREFIESLPSRVDPSRAAGLNTTYVLAIDGAGTWTVRADDDGVHVAEGDQGGDCTISAASETFERIVRGDQNPTTAYMTGKLKIKGDMGAAMKLKNLF
jgi:putative sterol carrier protein